MPPQIVIPRQNGKTTARIKGMTPEQRLHAIADILEEVDNRCMAVDGPVTETRHEITGDELRLIYRLAAGK